MWSLPLPLSTFSNQATRWRGGGFAPLPSAIPVRPYASDGFSEEQVAVAGVARNPVKVT